MSLPLFLNIIISKYETYFATHKPTTFQPIGTIIIPIVYFVRIISLKNRGSTMDEERRARRRKRAKRKRQREVKVARTIIACITIVVLIFAVWATKNFISNIKQKMEQEALARQQQEYQEQLKAEEKARLENTVHIAAVGDNLIHEKVYKSGIHEDGTYSYDHLYQYIKEDISAADMAIVNEECIFVADHANVSAYPNFGAPTEIGDALVDAGFDVVQHASNHTYDKGTSAITETLDYWKNNHPDIKVLGIHDNQESADTISTITCKNITFALLNYTEILNGDAENAYPSHMIDLLSYERLEKDVKKAEEIADMTIALLHTGEEYASKPSQVQTDYLNYLLSAGVDITICAHPHVLQKYEMLADENGNEMLVYYSLGNLISSQKDPDCLLGGMADISVYRNPETGDVSISDYGMIPLVTHYNYENEDYTVYKLEDYTNELASVHSIHEETDDEFTVEWLEKRYASILEAEY